LLDKEIRPATICIEERYASSITHSDDGEREEVNGMKKTVSKKALVKEAAFWSDFTRAVKENPGKVCHK
jgi:hypothetical protein